MATARDEGLAALQSGAYDTAVTLLESACREDPDDFWAHLYLGGAYHQLKRDEEAVQVLTRATQLQPTSAQARYNLGIALERLGRQAEALASIQSALALQSDYPIAQQALQRLQQAAPPQQTAYPGYGAGTPAPPPNYGAPPTQTPSLSDYGAAAPTLYGQPPANPQGGYAPPGYGQPAQPLYGMPLDNTQQGYGQTQQGYAQPGYPPPASPYGQPPMTPGPAGYGGYGQAQGGYGAVNWYEDRFDLGQAFKDWFQVITSPRSFFAQQQGREGYNAPMALMLAYSICYGIAMIIMSLIQGSGSGAFIIFFVIGAVIGIALGFVILLVIDLLLTGLVHLVGKMFGNSASYSGSFRAVVYAQAPIYIMVVLTMLLGPLLTPRPNTTATLPAQGHVIAVQYNQNPGFGGTGTSSGYPYGSSGFASNPLFNRSPVTRLLMFAGTVWSAILLGFGVFYIQRLSTAGAVGTVVISYIVVIGIGILISILIVAMFAGIIATGSSGSDMLLPFVRA